jgi:hypothetical protein
MSDSLAELDTRCTIAILHRDAPQDSCEVELDLEVSMVRNRQAAEDRGAAWTVYVPQGATLLVCGERPVLAVDLAVQQPADLDAAGAGALAYRHGLLLGPCRIPGSRRRLSLSLHKWNIRKNEVVRQDTGKTYQGEGEHKRE